MNNHIEYLDHQHDVYMNSYSNIVSRTFLSELIKELINKQPFEHVFVSYEGTKHSYEFTIKPFDCISALCFAVSCDIIDSEGQRVRSDCKLCPMPGYTVELIIEHLGKHCHQNSHTVATIGAQHTDKDSVDHLILDTFIPYAVKQLVHEEHYFDQVASCVGTYLNVSKEEV